MKNSRLQLVSLLFLALLLSSIQGVIAQGTTFTYQGRLDDNGAPANGSYDFRFRLSEDSLGNVFVGAPVLADALSVTGGLFTVSLDFGAVFTGLNYWVQVDVKTNGAGAYTTLIPLQKVLPTPYAIMANSASNLLGTLPTAQLNGTVGNSQLANDAVTSTKILDGTITSADLGPSSVNTTHIVDGQVANADLANDAVNSAKVLNGSLVGADLANETVTSLQLADTIALGDSNSLGRLDVFYANTLSNQPAITLFGNASQISTYGADGLEQIRLWGPSYGEILLHDSSTNNRNAAVLSANGAAGGYLFLYQGDSTVTGFRAYGDNLGGGRVLAYNSSNTLSLDLRAQFNSSTAAAWVGLYDEGSERVSFAARNGTSGRGGLIDVKNDSAANTLRLIGDTGASRGAIEMYNSGTVVGRFEGHSGGSWLRAYDETGSLAATFGSSASTGGFCELNNSSGAVGLRLDGDDSGGGLIQVRNAAGAVTITLDGDLTGDGRITTQELQITGGSDLSEQFDITPLNDGLKPGLIVCIDPRNPGQLVPSTKSYDRTVAGVISGAGGVKPGMLMGQKGTKADGQHPVALTGRVYCWVDATHHAIEPGDLITTSDTPGHAMKVTDHAKAQGAIIGKAMTALPEGKGLVLMLVSLQ